MLTILIKSPAYIEWHYTPRLSRMPCLQETGRLFCQLCDGRSHLSLIDDITVPMHVLILHVVTVICLITTMMVTHSSSLPTSLLFLVVLRVCVCLTGSSVDCTFCPHLSFLHSIFSLDPVCECCFGCDLLCLRGTCMCVWWGAPEVLLLSAPRQCLASVVRWGWIGSPSPLLRAFPSLPITFLTAKPCRTTTRRAAMTCCPTLTWRGTDTYIQVQVVWQDKCKAKTS